MTEVNKIVAAKLEMAKSEDWDFSLTNNGKEDSRGKSKACNRVEGSVRKKLGQEIGKAVADKSRGLFSADDWQCNKCGNVNWARRHQCNMCKAPKFGLVEERTGYGGGYNDRGVVEYIKRDDSDNEYDEFGRKRKNKHVNEDDSNKEEMGEDEEDEGEDDLSKYDLSGWGEEAEEEQKNRDVMERAKNRSNTDSNLTRPRSRSPSTKK